jgi:DNA (cytosine-5)-methyltransferase 1
MTNLNILNSYKVVSLFSGCGGSSLGYKLAGFEVLLANEFIDIAADTYQANFPNTIVLRDDIRKLTGEIILNKINLKVGELDLLDGSPPCQAFSTAGKREKKWNKIVKYSETKQRTDDLLFEYARILKEIKPKVFVCENVSGLAIGNAKTIFRNITELYCSTGYQVECRLLNAKYFNVAQNRPRLIWIGIRDDFNMKVTHPLPQFKPVPIKDVLKNVHNTEEDIKNASYPEHYSVMKYLKQMKQGESGSKYNEKGSYFGLMRLDWNKPANTILQSDAKHISCSAIHPDEHRRLTIAELKRISSFPDDFILLGDYKQQWERIGRAVPPFMMKAIAEHIRYQILDKINNVANNYNPSLYDEEQEITGQERLNFGINYIQFKHIK